MSLVNNDGELAVDVVDEPAMATLLHQEMATRGVDGRAARSKEERSGGGRAKAVYTTGLGALSILGGEGGALGCSINTRRGQGSPGVLNKY